MSNFALISLSNKISIGSIVKVNCLMKNMLQTFGSILSILFVILSVIWQWILQDFLFVCQKTRAQSVILLWLAHRIDVV